MNATVNAPLPRPSANFPIRVRDAAVYLGVSPQTMYLWVGESRFPISA